MLFSIDIPSLISTFSHLICFSGTKGASIPSTFLYATFQFVFLWSFFCLVSDEMHSMYGMVWFPSCNTNINCYYLGVSNVNRCAHWDWACVNMCVRICVRLKLASIERREWKWIQPRHAVDFDQYVKFLHSQLCRGAMLYLPAVMFSKMNVLVSLGACWNNFISCILVSFSMPFIRIENIAKERFPHAQ